MTISTLALSMMLAAQVVSVDTTDMPLSDFIRMVARAANMNVVLHPAVEGRVNLLVQNAPWEPTLDIVLKNHGFGKEIVGNIIRIVPENTLPLQTYVYPLSYVRAEDIAPIVATMVSPRGSGSVYAARNALIVRDVRPPQFPTQGSGAQPVFGGASLALKARDSLGRSK
jgi:type II secretory pathway component GspD/PulD (secretin)